MIKIKMSYIDDFGNRTFLNKEIITYPDQRVDEFDTMERFINNF